MEKSVKIVKNKKNKYLEVVSEKVNSLTLLLEYEDLHLIEHYAKGFETGFKIILFSKNRMEIRSIHIPDEELALQAYQLLKEHILSM